VLLKREGHEIVGLSMQLWNQRRSPGPDRDSEAEALRKGRCCSLDDVWDARRVATHLGFPFYVLNLEDEFERTVVEPFVATYLRGETPSPCILCNNHVKFRHLVERAARIGAGRVATGHYARVRYDVPGGRWQLLRGRDSRKDQSYFLFGLTQDQLSAAVFPLGELTKEEVREIARQAGLPTHDKPESQEICFVQDGSYRTFVEAYAGIEGEPGEILDTAGQVVGTHGGLHRYTVGQRKGLVASGRPQYVVRIDPTRNQVVIGDPGSTLRDEFHGREANWISIPAPLEPVRCEIRIRNRFEPQPGTVVASGPGVRVRFDSPQRAVTPGQAAVFYQGDVVLGGAWIDLDARSPA
jgi:tRNA-specific 2-thiouridylase